MRLVLAISSLGAGGAERVMALLAGALADRGHEVWLVTLAQSGHDFFPIDPRVRRVGLALTGDSPSRLHGVWANMRRVRALRRLLSSVAPDAVLSFMTSMNVLVILAASWLPMRIVVSERVDPAAHREARIWTLLRSRLYARADAVAVQTEPIAAWFRKHLSNRARVVVVANPVVSVSAASSAAAGQTAPFILGAGRLAHQKGFDVLIRAFGTLAAQYPDLRLVIAGEGPEGGRLRELGEGLGIAARVSFPGQVRELPALMKAAVAFVLPSRYEGIPNVLLEALAAGVPCVAADSPGGTREVLGGGVYGLLVPAEDCGALAEAITRLVTDEALRSRLSQAGATAIEPYRLERVVAEWEQLLIAS